MPPLPSGASMRYWPMVWPMKSVMCSPPIRGCLAAAHRNTSHPDDLPRLSAPTSYFDLYRLSKFLHFAQGSAIEDKFSPILAMDGIGMFDASAGTRATALRTCRTRAH